MVITGAGLAYALAVSNPAISTFQEELARKNGTPNFATLELTNAGSIVGALFGMAFPIAVLIVLLRPRIAAAFSDRARFKERTEDASFSDQEENGGGAFQPPPDKRWED
jgi:hypothetical protein